MEDTYARRAHLAHGALGVRSWTRAHERTRASPGAQPPSRAREDSVGEREGFP